jgi:virulence-associated protein VagC
METAKLFINGRSQAVRLPKAYRFDQHYDPMGKTE